MKPMNRSKDQILKTYMQKYQDEYRVRPAEDGIWEVTCRGNSTIGLYSQQNSLLYYSFAGGKSSRAKTALLQKLNGVIDYNIVAEGDIEVMLSFPESQLEQAEDVFKIRKRKQLSDEQRDALRERGRMLAGMR